MSFCAIVGCGNKRGKKDKEGTIRFYSIPCVRKNEGPDTYNLSLERRTLWLSRINRREEPTSYWRVCSEHFIHGAPTHLYPGRDPDWAPSLNLGHNKFGSEIGSADRYLRRCYRQMKKNVKNPVQSDEEDIENEPPENENELPETEIEPQEIENEPLEIDNEPPEIENVLPEEDVFDLPDVAGLDNENEIRSPPTTTTTKANTTDELKECKAEVMYLRRMKQSKWSHESFEKNDKRIHLYTGIPKYSTFKALFDFIETAMPESGPNCKLDNFQKLLITLMRLKLNTNVDMLADIFEVSKSTISRTFTSVLHVLYVRLEHLIHWPDREELHKTMPMTFREKFGSKITIILDCFEIFIEKPSNMRARAMTWSNYKHHNTIKYLIGTLPQCTTAFISVGYGGRASDKFITHDSGILERLQPGDVVMADRGFNVQESVTQAYAKLEIPAFTKGKSQLSALEVEKTRDLAHVRIHVERVIGLVMNKYTFLQSIIPLTYLNSKPGEKPTIDKIVTVCCALTNLCPPIISPD